MSSSRAFVSHAVVLGLLLAFPRGAGAHEVVPSDWCVDEKRAPQIVAKFKFDGNQLRELMDKCGIVEDGDEWGSAALTIVEYCKVVAPLKGAVPFVVGPDNYRATDHHSSYRLDDGLVGSCAVCPPKTE